MYLAILNKKQQNVYCCIEITIKVCPDISLSTVFQYLHTVQIRLPFFTLDSLSPCSKEKNRNLCQSMFLLVEPAHALVKVCI